MPVSPGHGALAYRQVQAESSASPLELVLMLYDGAIASLGQAREAMARRDAVVKGRAMSKALSIVGHLQSTLDMEKGREVAEQLDRLYVYVTGRLLEANINGAVEPIDESIALLSTVRDAWAQAATTPAPRQ
jgi:flagellar protein FliS